MGWFIRVLLCLSVSLSALGHAGVAVAQTDAAKRAKASELFRSGTALADENRWREALSAFEQAGLLVPHASTTYNMAYCERGLGRLTRARHLFIRALRENGERGGLSEDQQTSAASYRAEAEQQLARVSVRVAPDDATLTVDGRPLVMESTSPPLAVAGVRPPGPGAAVPAAAFQLWLDPGAHVFFIAHADGRQHTVTRSFGPGNEALLELKLPANPSLAPTPTPAPTRLPAPEPSVRPDAPSFWNSQRIGAAVVTVAAVGLLATGIALSVKTANTWSDAQDACPGSVNCPDDVGFERSLDATRDGNLATVAWVTAGLAAVGATYLWITAPSSDVTVGASPGGVVVRGAF